MKQIILDKERTKRLVYVASVNADYMVNVDGLKYRIGSLHITMTESGSILEYPDTPLGELAALDLVGG